MEIDRASCIAISDTSRCTSSQWSWKKKQKRWQLWSDGRVVRDAGTNSSVQSLCAVVGSSSVTAARSRGSTHHRGYRWQSCDLDYCIASCIMHHVLHPMHASYPMHPIIMHPMHHVFWIINGEYWRKLTVPPASPKNPKIVIKKGQYLWLYRKYLQKWIMHTKYVTLLTGDMR